MRILLGLVHMNTTNRLIVLTVCSVLVLMGAGCSLFEKSPAEERQAQTEAVLTQDDRTLYVENVQIKIDDLDVHLGKLREYRGNVGTSVQWVYDKDLEAFETALNDFKDKFAIFKETAANEFITHRATLNDALVRVEDVYLEIITEFEIDFSEQP